jgi:hypothetical protein
MWIRRSHVLVPLAVLTSNTSKWQWGEEEQKAFNMMKCIIGKEVLLAYPNFSKEFVIHTRMPVTGVLQYLARPSDCGSYQPQEPNLQGFQHRMCFMRWRLPLGEYGPELHYIKGEHNIVADALSWLDMVKEPITTPATLAGSRSHPLCR